jgi:hypothetical protein
MPNPPLAGPDSIPDADMDRNKPKVGNQTEDELAGYGGEDVQTEGSPPKGHRVKNPNETRSPVAGEVDDEPPK